MELARELQTPCAGTRGQIAGGRHRGRGTASSTDRGAISASSTIRTDCRGWARASSAADESRAAGHQFVPAMRWRRTTVQTVLDNSARGAAEPACGTHRRGDD